MRIICVSPSGILDTQTGEVSEKLELEKLLLSRPGGVISGINLYEPLCNLIPEVRKDEGWTVSIHAQQQRVNPLTDDKRVKGLIYVSRLTYRFPKKGNRYKGERYRDPAIKWLVLNLELFTDTGKFTLPNEFLIATKAILRLAKNREIKPKHSPASLGSALLRASPEWDKRNPAPHFISELARDYLPGNYYVISEKFKRERINHCYYLDQQSSHHKIASSVPLPHPHWLRARGRLRSVEEGNHPCWIDVKQLHLLRQHVGLLCCLVECDTIPGPLIHLYPPWTRERGTHVKWIWTPELRLFDRRVRLRHVCCGLTSIRLDTALWEYAEWALSQLGKRDKDIVKSTLLAAYGMLACRTNRTLHLYTVHGRRKPPRAELCELPLLKDVFRSTVERVRIPAIQNVVARGVIEAETRTRSIEYARQLESEHIPVAQIYADGLLAVTEQLPLMLPEHWRASASLTRVHSPHPNQIISDQLVRLPGFSSGRREAYLRQDAEGWHSREFEPSVSL